MTPQRQALIDNPKQEWEFLAFWGHRDNHDGSIGAGCLSQWYPAPFEVGTSEHQNNFLTAEQYMMCSKALLFGDVEMAQRIYNARTPKEAKELGRRVRNFDEVVWDREKYGIVVRGTKAKFKQNRELGRYLRSTGTKILVEASPYDRVWGVGMAAGDARIAQPARWLGENLLGFALMEARDYLNQLAVIDR